MGKLENVELLIQFMDENFSEINGPEKIFILKMVQEYYRSLTEKEATSKIMTDVFSKLAKY